MFVSSCRRSLGTRPMLKRDRLKANRTPKVVQHSTTHFHRKSMEPMLRFITQRKFDDPKITLGGLKPRTIGSKVTSEGDMVYYWKDTPIMKFKINEPGIITPVDNMTPEDIKEMQLSWHAQSEKSETWKMAFALEKKLVDYMTDSPNVGLERFHQRLMPSGDALYFNPSGQIFLYGSKKELGRLCEAHAQEKGDNVVKLFPVSIGNAFEALTSSKLGLKDYLVHVAGKNGVHAPALDAAVDARKAIGHGVHSLAHTLAAIDMNKLDPNGCVLIMVRRGLRQRDPFEFVLPGGKRRFFETAHKCAERSLKEECGFDEILVPFNTPSVHKGASDDHLKTIMFVQRLQFSSVSEIKLFEHRMTEYSKRFELFEKPERV